MTVYRNYIIDIQADWRVSMFRSYVTLIECNIVMSCINLQSTLQGKNTKSILEGDTIP